MAIFHEQQLQCPRCKREFAAHLADSINAARAPEAKQALLQRQLNRVDCPGCGLSAVVEKDLLYVDPQRHLCIAVSPDAEKSLADLEGQLTHRVASLEGLREIVVADDHGISSKRLRLFKVYLYAADPRLHLGSSRLFLDSVDGENLVFLRLFSGDVQPMRVEIARVMLDAMFAGRDGVKDERGGLVARAADFVAALGNVFDPAQDALNALERYARQAEEGEAFDLASSDFLAMLKGLPPVERMTRATQSDLDVIFAYACSRAQDHALGALFEARFGFALDQDWLHNHSRMDVPVLWAALRDLPDAAVERNEMVQSVNLEPGNRGVYFEALRRIDIGEAIVNGGVAGLRHCILHEMGHATHSLLDRRTDRPASVWLVRQFGWRVYDPDQPEQIDAWVMAMGGYPSGATLQVRQDVADMIRLSMGNAPSFIAAPIADYRSGHLWNDRAFGPRAAFEKTGSDWWLRSEHWHLARGKRFFVNYNYRLLMEVADDTVRFIMEHAPDRYALSAPQEFFAEMFAWCYDMNHFNRAGLPQHVIDWFFAQVGPPDGVRLNHSWL